MKKILIITTLAMLLLIGFVIAEAIEEQTKANKMKVKDVGNKGWRNTKHTGNDTQLFNSSAVDNGTTTEYCLYPEINATLIELSQLTNKEVIGWKDGTRQPFNASVETNGNGHVTSLCITGPTDSLDLLAFELESANLTTSEDTDVWENSNVSILTFEPFNNNITIDTELFKVVNGVGYSMSGLPSFSYSKDKWKFGMIDLLETNNSWNQYYYEFSSEMKTGRSKNDRRYGFVNGNHFVPIDDSDICNKLGPNNESPNCSYETSFNNDTKLNYIKLSFWSNNDIDPTFTLEDVENDRLFEGTQNIEGINITHIETNTTGEYYFDNCPEFGECSGMTFPKVNTTNYGYAIWLRYDSDTPTGADTILTDSDGPKYYPMWRQDPTDLRFQDCSTTAVDVPQDEWFHAVMTGDGTNAYVYINGVFNKSASCSITAIDVNILGEDFASQKSFGGDIDEFYIFHKNLTASEVTDIYNLNKSDYNLSIPNLFAYYSFDDLNDFGNDDSNNHNDMITIEKTAFPALDERFPHNDPWSYLVAYYNFDLRDNLTNFFFDKSLSTNEVYDLSPLTNFVTDDDNIGDPNSGVSFSNEDGVGHGYYANFDGLSGGIELGNHTAGMFEEPHTLMAWIRAYDQGADTQVGLIGNWDGSNDGATFALRDKGADNWEIIYALQEDNGKYIFKKSTNDAITWGQWYHVAVTWNGNLSSAGNDINLFVDGVELTTGQTSTLGTGTITYVSPKRGIQLGRTKGVTPDQWLNGSMDEVMMFSTNLTEQQISDIYNNQSGIFKAQGNITYMNQYTNINSTDNKANITLDAISSQGSSTKFRMDTWSVSDGYNISMDGLIGYWNFDGDGDDDTGNVVTTVNGDIQNGTGVFDGSYDMDDDGDYVSSTNDTYEFQEDDAFSFGGWIKWNELTRAWLIGQTDNANPNDGWSLHRDTGGELEFRHVSAYGTDRLDVYTTTTISATDEWKHIFVTYTGSTDATGVKIYIDGVSDSLTTTTDTLDPGDSIDYTGYDFEINGRDSGSNLANASFDDIMIFNRSLSESEVKELYVKGRANWQTGTATTLTDPTIDEDYAYYSALQNLSVYYHADGNADDALGVNDGVLINGAEADETGVYNKSFQFDGVDDYVNISHFADVNSTSFTVMAWFKQNATSPSNGAGIVTTHRSGFGSGWALRTLTSDSEPELVVRTSGGLRTTESLVLGLADNSWHHVAATWNDDTATARLYVDGEFTATEDWADSESQTLDDEPMRIGGTPSASNTYFPGLIDEVMFFTAILDNDTINEIYLRGADRYEFTNDYSFTAATNYLPVVELHAGTNSYYTPLVTGDLEFETFSSFNVEFVEPTAATGTIQESTNVTVNVTSVGADNITIYLYNQSLSLLNTSISLTSPFAVTYNVTQGIYFYNATAEKGASTVNTETRNITVDFLPPTLAFVSPTPSNNAFSSESFIEVNVTATDFLSISQINITFYNSTGDQINVTVDTSGATSLYVNLSGLADGTYTYNASSNDSLGLTGYSETRNITLDNVNPTITLLNPANDSYVIVNQNYTGNVTDETGLDYVELYINDILQETFSSLGGVLQTVVASVENVADGIYSWFMRVFDLAGNSVDSEQRNITIDVDVPVITVTSPTAQTYTTRNISINFTATDNFAIADLWFYNGTGNTTYTSEIYEIIPEGSYSYIFYANNTYGRLGSTTVNFDVDLMNIHSVTTYPSTPNELENNSLEVNVTSYAEENGTCYLQNQLGPSQFNITNGNNFFNFTTAIISDGSYNYDIVCNTTISTETYSDTLVVAGTRDLYPVSGSISFSDPNPLVGETFTISATIKSDEVTSNDAVVRFYDGSTLLGNDTLSITQDSTSVAILSTSISSEGPRIILISVNEEQVLIEGDYTNNNLTRPIVIGGGSLGDINVTNSFTVDPVEQYGSTNATGTAIYNFDPFLSVSGAMVTVSVPNLGDYNGTTLNGAFTVEIPYIDLTPDNYTVNITVDDGSIVKTIQDNLEVIESSPTFPDFTITSTADIVFTPTTALINESVNISVTVYNLGNTSNTTLLFTAEGVNISSTPITDLSQGNQQTFNFTYNFTSDGYRPVKFTLDENNTVVESDENNNDLTKTIRIFRNVTDLIPSDISFSDNTPNINNPITITATIKNVQGLASGEFTVDFYDNGTWFNRTNITSLDGKDASTTTSVNYTFLTEGDHNITVAVNNGSIVTEEDYSNNNRSEVINVLPTALPDLLGSVINSDDVIGTDLYFIDTPITLRFTIGQIGNANMTQDFNVSVTFNESEVNRSTLSSLNIGDEYIYNYTHTAGKEFLGTTDNTFIFSADPDNKVTEEIETNNNQSTVLQPIYTDLRVLSANIVFNDSNPAVGENILITPLIENLGTGTALNVLIMVNDSNGNNIGNDTINISASSSVFANITASFSVQGTQSVIVDVNTDYKIYEHEEGNNDFTESSANNLATKSIDVGDVSPPNVTLIDPTNNTQSTLATHSFAANFSNDALSNATLYIWNSTGDIILSNLTIVTGATNSSNVTNVLPYNGIFEWNYQVFDTANNSAYATVNWTITYDDTAPVITAPGNTSILDTGSLSVIFNATDNLAGVDTFYENNANFQINSTGHLQTVGSLSAGSYSVIVFVNDTLGNTANYTYGLVVNSTAVATRGGGGTGLTVNITESEDIIPRELVKDIDTVYNNIIDGYKKYSQIAGDYINLPERFHLFMFPLVAILLLGLIFVYRNQTTLLIENDGSFFLAGDDDDDD